MQVRKIRNRTGLVLLFLFSCWNTIIAQTNESNWTKGNDFYNKKQYDSASVYYEALVSSGVRDARLHYNLGNTYYRLNRTGEAILHYEKALHLDPGNNKAKENLALARNRIVNAVPEVAPIFFVKWWDTMLGVFSPNTWALLSLLLFVCLLSLIFFARIRKEQFAYAGRWLSLNIVCILVCGCMAYFSYDAATNSGKAVVLQPAASFLDAPQLSAKVLGNLPEGTVIEVYAEEGNFINVKLPNGRVGWIMANAVRKV
jgi:tetratricopeptide (TPR) repeat protein